MAAHLIWPNIWFNTHKSLINYSVPPPILKNARFLHTKSEKTCRIDVWSGAIGSGGLSDDLLHNRTGLTPPMVAIKDGRFSRRLLTPPDSKVSPWEMLFHLRRGADDLLLQPWGPVFQTAQDLLFHEIEVETRFWLCGSNPYQMNALYLRYQYALPAIAKQKPGQPIHERDAKDHYYVGVGKVVEHPRAKAPRYRLDWADWELSERCEEWVNEALPPPTGKACVGSTGYGLIGLGPDGPRFECAPWGDDEGMLWKNRRWMTRADLEWRRSLAAAALKRIDDQLAKMS